MVVHILHNFGITYMFTEILLNSPQVAVLNPRACIIKLGRNLQFP